ncbi:MAG: beta-ketoacyl synthase [Vicinamibacterales bacterium]
MPSESTVVVTGLGCLSALGRTVDEFWSALEAGRCGIRPITRVPPDKVQIGIAAEVDDSLVDAGEADRAACDRYSLFALAAAREAVHDAGLDFPNDESLRRATAVVVASGVGGWDTLNQAFEDILVRGRRRPHPLTVPRLMISAATSHVSRTFGLTGPAFTISSACSSSTHAIGEAYWMIRTGRVRAAVVGGAESESSLTSHRAWEALRVLAPDTCRPFSRDRRGMVIGEGAGILVLERLEDARARGAHIYCELAGYGASADAGDLVAPDASGASAAITEALAMARLNTDDVDYINAHGTGTVVNDRTEVQAIRRAFGTTADRLMVSSTKSMHGHALGAAGALEAVATVKTLEQQVVPPTINYLGPDPECDLDHVPHSARRTPVRAALSNSLAFGGLNAVLAFRPL